MHEDWGIALGEEIDESGDPPRIWHPYGDYPVKTSTKHLGKALSRVKDSFLQAFSSL